MDKKAFLKRVVSRASRDDERFNKVKGLFEIFYDVSSFQVAEYMQVKIDTARQWLSAWKECGFVERKANKWRLRK